MSSNTPTPNPLLEEIRLALVTGLSIQAFKGGLFQEGIKPASTVAKSFDRMIQSPSTTLTEKKTIINIKRLYTTIALSDKGVVNISERLIKETKLAMAMMTQMFNADKDTRDAGKVIIEPYPYPSATPMPKFGPYINFFPWVRLKLLNELHSTNFKNGLFENTITTDTKLLKALNILLGAVYTTAEEKRAVRVVRDVMNGILKNVDEGDRGVEMDKLTVPMAVIAEAWPKLEGLWEVFKKDEVRRHPELWVRPHFLQATCEGKEVFETYVFERDGRCTITKGGTYGIPPGAPDFYVKRVLAQQAKEKARREVERAEKEARFKAEKDRVQEIDSDDEYAEEGNANEYDDHIDDAERGKYSDDASSNSSSTLRSFTDDEDVDEDGEDYGIILVNEGNGGVMTMRLLGGP